MVEVQRQRGRVVRQGRCVSSDALSGRVGAVVFASVIALAVPSGPPVAAQTPPSSIPTGVAASSSPPGPNPADPGSAVPGAPSVRRPLTAAERRRNAAAAAAAAAARARATSATTTAPLTRPSAGATTTSSITATTTTTTTTTTTSTTTTIPPTTTTTLEPWAIDASSSGVLRRPTVLGGAFRFEPPSAERPKRSRTDAALLGRRSVQKTVWQRPNSTDVFFAVFATASRPAATPQDPASGPPLLGRPVWVVRYRGVVSSRATPVTIPSRRATSTTVGVTTSVPDARTDIVVVFDDATGAQLIRSEFAAETPPRT